MVGQLADLLLHCGDEIEISHQLVIAGLINNSQKAAHEAGVLGHGVRFFCAFPELGSKGDRHGCENGLISNLKGVQGRLCALRRVTPLYRTKHPIKQFEQLATDLLKLLHLLLLREVRAFRQPFTHRGEAPAFTVVGHALHQYPKEAQLIITTLCADTQLHQKTAAPNRGLQPGKNERSSDSVSAHCHRTSRQGLRLAFAAGN